MYRDQDLLYRVIREACTEDVAEIVLDTPFAMQRTQQILQNWNMLKNIKLTVYKGSEPLLQASGIMKEIKAALQIKVMLPSGGYLFIQTTEALSVVDVNSGKFVSSATQDETILKTNIEAAHEIARQLRLRNIGGMIIIDFIDMTNRNDKLAVMEEFELALENDKAKPQIGQLSDLGLVELTRHRQGQSLSEVFTKKCPHCQGTGMIFEDIQLAAAPGENELKAKAAKLKVPVQQLKNKNQKNNNVFQVQVTETEPVQQTAQEVENVQDAVEENTNNNSNGNNNGNNYNNHNNNKFNKKFNKNRNKFNKFNKNNFNNNQQQKDDMVADDVKSDTIKSEEHFSDTVKSAESNKPEITQKVDKAENVVKEAPEVKAPETTTEKVEKQEKSAKAKKAEKAEKTKNTVVESEKVSDDKVEEKPKKRGRKPKAKVEETVSTEEKTVESKDEKTEEKPKRRGRKPKAATV